MVLTATVIISLNGITRAQPLPFVKEHVFDSLCATFIITACDSCTIREGCKKGKACPVAAHLAGYARWLVVNGKSYDSCMKAVSGRYEFLVSEKRTAVDVRRMPVVGSPGARVVIVVHVLDMCPLCSFLFRELYREVTIGKLAGKARLVARPFAERVDSAETAGFAPFWDYIASLNDKTVASEQQGPIKTAHSETPGKKLPWRMMAIKRPVPFRSKGSTDVSPIPPLFINGKLYRGEKSPQWVVDAALYEYEKTASKIR